MGSKSPGALFSSLCAFPEIQISIFEKKLCRGGIQNITLPRATLASTRDDDDGFYEQYFQRRVIDG
jgi:hypothetical protein